MPFAAQQLLHAGEWRQFPDIQMPSRFTPKGFKEFAVENQNVQAVQLQVHVQALLHTCKEESETFVAALMCQYGTRTRMTRTALKHLADFRFYFQRFRSCPIIHMRNAWLREGPVDQAKRSECTQLFRISK